MSSSPKKFGAVLTNKLSKMSVSNQRIYQLERRMKHHNNVKRTGVNWAKPLKKLTKKRERSVLSTIR